MMNSTVTIHSRAGLNPPQTIAVRLGQHIRTDPRPIAKHCLKPLATVSEDIATIVESIALADRLQTRRRAQGWTRCLDLEIPVYEFDVFSAPSVHASLVDVVHFLTGDEWQISFVRRSGMPLKENYLPLIEKQPDFVVPFSDGLDSFAQWKLLKKKYGEASVWEVRAGKLQKGGDRPRRSLLEVPRGFRAGHPRERTYRTRPLVYFSFAAIAAATIKAKAVVIGENGQGALGPSFARFGNEWPLRSAHPGFIIRLGNFLSKTLDSPIKFEQPQLWRTKAQVLSDLRENDLLDGWEGTRSCSLRPMQRKGRTSCGLCGGCLLRQTAVNAAGLTREHDFLLDLKSPDLTVVENGLHMPLGQNEKEILTRSALSMTLLAEIPLRVDASDVIAREARDIPGLPKEVSERRLRSLIQRHAIEWRSLLESLPSDAWLSRQFLTL